MKKLILGFLLSLGISSTLFAEVDFIALATNGEFNEQSAGVKALSDEEMRQVVGGAHLEYWAYHYGMVNNGGARVSYTAYYTFEADTSIEAAAYNLLSVDNGSRQYIPVVSATLNHLTNQVSVSIIGANQYNPVYTRPADRYYANKLLEDGSLYNQVNRVIRGHSATFWNQNVGKYKY